MGGLGQNRAENWGAGSLDWGQSVTFSHLPKVCLLWGRQRRTRSIDSDLCPQNPPFRA